MIIAEVRKFRKRQSRVGGRKLHRMLNDSGFKIGRDKLFALLRKHRMLVVPKKKYPKTTNSYHRFRKYKNLI
ncbi:unnamed protein product, partial [marine sediment metagenome]